MRIARLIALFSVILLTVARGARCGVIVVDFEDLNLAADSYVNGSDGSGGFTSRGAFFNNIYDSTWDVWSGWAASTMTDTTTAGFLNQYSAVAGSGAGGSATYGVAFAFFPNEFDTVFFDAYVNLPDGTQVLSIDVTNTTYSALAMRDGDAFAQEVGGPTGNDRDFFLLTITGFDAPFAGAGVNPGNAVGSVEFYLADYGFDDNLLDFLVTTWRRVDLSALAGARSLGFALRSSDVGPFGMNTPAYFALDNLRVRALSVPEPASFALVALGLATLGLFGWRRGYSAVFD